MDTTKYEELFRQLGLDAPTAQKFLNIMNAAMDKHERSEIIGEAGGGMVKIIGNGRGTISKVEIDPIIFKEQEAQLVSDLFAAACNNFKEKMEEKLKEIEYQLDLDLRAVLYKN